jgi:hydrogenase/urease accessory protein HupE
MNGRSTRSAPSLKIFGTGQRILLAMGLLLLATSSAEAHLVQTGFGKFYDGIAHLLITPSDLMVTVGFALLAGMQGKPTVRRVMIALPALWLTGGFAGMTIEPPPFVNWVTGLTVLTIGALIALDLRIPVSLTTVMASLSGLLFGWVNGTTMTPLGADRLALVGAVSAVFVIVTLLSAIVVDLRPSWTRIIVRVAGSWIAAISILTLGWLAKGLMR